MESGGYDAKFVENPSDCFKCVVCHFVLKNPVLFVDCGHRVCQLCFVGIKENAAQGGTKLLCPFDRMEVDITKVYEDKGISRAILDFKVLCNNSSGGCQWVGELRHLQSHLGTNCENAIPRQLMKRIETCETELKQKDMEIASLNQTINSLYRHLMNVDEYIPHVRTVFIWKLDISSYDAPMFSPKFYSRLNGHYCMLRVSFISVPDNIKSVRFGIYFHIVKGVNGEEVAEPFNMKVLIEARNKHGKMDTFQFTRDDISKDTDKSGSEKTTPEPPSDKPKSDKSTPVSSKAKSASDGSSVSNEDELARMPDLSKFIINDSLTIKCTLLDNKSL